MSLLDNTGPIIPERQASVGKGQGGGEDNAGTMELG